MMYKKSLLYKRDASKSFSSERKKRKENTSNFQNTAKSIIENAKEKIKETFTDENIEKVKKKAGEFTDDAKETFETLRENGSELASEAAEHLADFKEEVQEEIKETSVKVKNFIKDLTKK